MRWSSRKDIDRRWQSGEVAQMMRLARPIDVQHAELMTAISVPFVWAVDTVSHCPIPTAHHLTCDYPPRLDIHPLW